MSKYECLCCHCGETFKSIRKRDVSCVDCKISGPLQCPNTRDGLTPKYLNPADFNEQPDPEIEKIINDNLWDLCAEPEQSECLDKSEITDELLQELGRVPCEDIQTDLGLLTGVELLYVTIEGYQPPFCLFSDENADDYRVCVSSLGTIWNVSPGDIRILRLIVDEMRAAKEAERPDKIHAGGRGSSKSLLFAAEIKKAKEAE